MYIDGVDGVWGRDIIDVTLNHYGDFLLDFLVDCNLIQLQQIMLFSYVLHSNYATCCN